MLCYMLDDPVGKSRVREPGWVGITTVASCQQVSLVDACSRARLGLSRKNRNNRQNFIASGISARENRTGGRLGSFRGGWLGKLRLFLRNEAKKSFEINSKMFPEGLKQSQIDPFQSWCMGFFPVVHTV